MLMSCSSSVDTQRSNYSYGGGNSTLWLKKREFSVGTCKQWYWACHMCVVACGLMHAASKMGANSMTSVESRGTSRHGSNLV